MAEAEIIKVAKAKLGFSLKVGARFRKVRLSQRVRVVDLARHLGMSEQAVLQFETGKQKLDLERFANACLALGANSEYVLYRRGKMVTGEALLPAALRHKAARKPEVEQLN